MSLDMAQFHQVFFEESLEGLDLMEQALLGLEGRQPDAETINSIFRAAHSIKGGAATFGFSEAEAEAAADEAAVAETALHLLRGGVGGHVEILRPHSEHEVPHAAPGQIGLVAFVVQAVENVEGVAADVFAADAVIGALKDCRFHVVA